MNKAKAILIFQRKLFIPAVLITAGVFILMPELMPAAGFMYIGIACVLHYFLYDSMSPGDYYIYNNMGLSKAVLWISTVGIGLVLTLLLKTALWIFM